MPTLVSPLPRPARPSRPPPVSPLAGPGSPAPPLRLRRGRGSDRALLLPEPRSNSCAGVRAPARYCFRSDGSRATTADLPALLPMMISFNQGESIDWNPELGATPLRHLLSSPELGQVLLFSEGAAHLGYAIFTYGFDLEFGGRDSFLTELYLVPEARGRGVGKWALEQIFAQVRLAGAQAIHLQVRADNTPAQRLYAAAGFIGTTRHLLSRDLSNM